MPRGSGKYGEPRPHIKNSGQPPQKPHKNLVARIKNFEDHGDTPRPQGTRFHRPGSQRKGNRG